MGVPKFFRYISERYPCLSEVIKEYQIPEFDNLYLDMNGIIHTCSHPNDNDPHFRITEEQIFKDVFHYIEILFRMIQPKKLFFMAVDGVAPRAKMNQQRGRRFRSGKEAEILEKKAISKGEILPDQKRFDSNCITPGTVFMARLQEQLKYFVTYKISTDKIWQIPQIILSGHETPGEGEHKIMDYIRYLRSQGGWDPNIRHCLYGLDADLIMLGMCTHEPHFSLLREEVKFGKSQKRVTTPEETTFYLLHLSLLRDYLGLEFQSLKKTLPFPYDIERIIDDWVLMGFLVGNDFIPNLPGLNIAEGALQLLYQIYIEVLPSLGGYINDGGNLNLERFEAYLQRLAQFDIDRFRETYADLKYFESKTGRKMLPREDSFNMGPMSEELQNLIVSTEMALANGDENSGEESDVDTTDSDEELKNEFKLFKMDYYMNKLDFEQVTMEVLTSQAEGYVQAIQWNLHYYYHGCPSWSWFYQHHYSPYISDIKGFSKLKIEFDFGRPFLPFQQLLAVLPSSSKELLPEPLQKLMCSVDSPLLSYYPKDFEIDMNGKKQEWEGVVLIPFIDQDALLKAMEPCYEQLSEEERVRNSHGPMNIYNYTSENLGSYEAPEFFPKVIVNHAKRKEVWAAEICVDRKDLIQGLYPGVSESYVIGFPTLKHIPFTASLEKMKVKVFDHPSRGENMILTVRRNHPADIELTAQHTIGKTVLVNWPHLIQAKVSSLSTEEVMYSLDSEEGEMKLSLLKQNDSSFWNLMKAGTISKYKSRMGIELGEVKLLVWAHPFEGTKLQFDDDCKTATLVMVWSKDAIPYPYQTILADVALYKTVEQVPRTLIAIFPIGSTSFMLMGPRYGSMGTVMEDGKEGRVKVSIIVQSDPDFNSLDELMKTSKKSYFTGKVASQKVGMGGHLFSKITGTIFVQSAHTESDKTNIGLNLKFNKKNEELFGFTKKLGNQWYYSDEAIELVKTYFDAFPELFQYLSLNTSDESIYFKEDMYPENGAEKVREIVNWLKVQPHCDAEKRTVGAERIEEEVVLEIERIVKNFTPKKLKRLILHATPYLLFQPKHHLGLLEPDPNSQHQLLDRIVNVRECHSIPLGLKGTIIGIDKKDTREGTLYEIVFDQSFVGGLKLGTLEPRCYRLTRQAFINISHGVRTGRAQFEIVPPPLKELQACSANAQMYVSSSGTSAFANWSKNQQPEKQGSNQSTDFFSNYQTKPGAEAQQNFRIHKPTADSEFSAMWQVLQNQKKELGLEYQLKSQQQPVNQPLMNQRDNRMAQHSSVSQQTDALKKFLKLDNGPSEEPSLRPDVPTPKVVARPAAKACSHGNCCSALMSMCDDKNYNYPSYNYAPNLVTNEITSTLRFPGVRQEIIGHPQKDKKTAAESAACKAISMLEKGTLQTPRVMGPGWQQNSILGGQLPLHQPHHSQHPDFWQRVPPPGFNNQHGGARPQPHLKQSLPTPPQQWYQQNNSMPMGSDSLLMWRTREDNQHSKQMNGTGKQQSQQGSTNVGNSHNQFLPLQVLKGSSRLGTPKLPTNKQIQQENNPENEKSQQNIVSQEDHPRRGEENEENPQRKSPISPRRESSGGCSSSGVASGSSSSALKPNEVSGEETPKKASSESPGKTIQRPGSNQGKNNKKGGGGGGRSRGKTRIAAKFPVPMALN